VDPEIYNSYNQNMYLQAIDEHAPVKFITYFQQEAVRYKEYLSYQQYISIINPKNFFQEIYYKLAYIFYILKIRTEL